MKFINSRIALFFAIVLAGLNMAYAQEVIPETPKDTVKLLPQFGVRSKIDGVIAVVGDFVVLDSDIDLMYRELQAQNVPIKDITRCELLGKLMEDKLYAHHAIQDSIVVSDADVNEKMNRQIDYFVENLGSEDKMVAYFKKKSIDNFKTELFDMIKNQELTSRMQKKIIDGVEITPEEVRQFYLSFKPEDRPTFGAELEVAQIVIKPEVTQAEKQKVIDKLKQIKKDIQDGASFYSKAVLYSEDRGSGQSGGYLKMDRKTNFVKEFKEAAFSLAEGEISDPVETEFGYHLIYIEKIRGQQLDVRHILMSAKPSPEDIQKAKEKALNIREKIVSGQITFADAARSESDEKETRNNGGLLINPQTFTNRFELTKLPSEIYNDIVDLKDNEVSQPLKSVGQRGEVTYKLMKITGRYDEHPADYAQDYTKIKDLALKEKQIKEIAKWSGKKIKDTYIKVNGEYRNCKFANQWVK